MERNLLPFFSKSLPFRPARRRQPSSNAPFAEEEEKRALSLILDQLLFRKFSDGGSASRWPLWLPWKHDVRIRIAGRIWIVPPRVETATRISSKGTFDRFKQSSRCVPREREIIYCFGHG